MHKNFFDRAKDAVENGYYLEALFLEYAAIEGRLEVLLGILDYPCNKNLSPSIRKDIKISHRINCIQHRVKNDNVLFETSKIPKDFYEKKGLLLTWTNQRNVLIHGYYKNAAEYSNRSSSCEELAKNGLEYARLLYNETKRLRRLLNSSPELFLQSKGECRESGCKAYCKNNGSIKEADHG